MPGFRFIPFNYMIAVINHVNYYVTDTSKEWQTAVGPNKFCSGCLHEEGKGENQKLDG
jgi:hypothetical protein